MKNQIITEKRIISRYTWECLAAQKHIEKRNFHSKDSFQTCAKKIYKKINAMDLNKDQQDVLESNKNMRENAETGSEIEEEESSTIKPTSFEIFDLTKYPESINDWTTEIIVNNTAGNYLNIYDRKNENNLFFSKLRNNILHLKSEITVQHWKLADRKRKVLI
jgi:hypothetical protein